jgi:GTP-binding protein
MNIKSARFLTSVAARDKILDTGMPEFAFVGRSNVGKSSIINNLVGIKDLAKTSSMPGLTKLVNYFVVNENFIFVDLPGYGYAKASKEHQGVWSSLIGDYLLKSPDLKMVFVLLDIRHKPNELDKIMIEFLIDNGLDFSIIATKADKLSTMAQKKAVDVIAKELNMRKEMIFVHSSRSSIGKEKVLNFVEGVINI